MFDLTGRIALVTGASGGIGGAIARAIHAQGGVVLASGRRRETLQALVDDLGARAHVVVGDLAADDGPAALAKAAERVAAAAGGGVDVLVNNAGLTRDALALRMRDEHWREVIEVNLTAGFGLSRALLRGMMKRRWGRIVGIASIVGVTGNPGQANYAASKAGMIGMSKALAAEVARRGVTVNCIAPGFIATAMTDALTAAQREKLLDATPIGRLGEPGDIAAAAVYLASEEAAYVTGQTLHVNGGMAMI